MNEQIIKNNIGKVIFKISTSATGVNTFKYQDGTTLFSHDPKTNKAKDLSGKEITINDIISLLKG